MTDDNQHAITCLLHAVDSAQASARAWDVRAQIAGIGYIFSIGVINSIEADLVSRSLPSHLLDFALLLFFIIPIIGFGYVLFPRYKSDKQPLATGEEFSAVSFGLFQGKTEQELAEHVAGLDWEKELVSELSQLSVVRDIKRRRFVIALYLCCVTYGFAVLDYVASIFIKSLKLNTMGLLGS